MRLNWTAICERIIAGIIGGVISGTIVGVIVYFAHYHWGFK